MLQIMNQKDHQIKEKNKKVTGLMNDELSETDMTEFAALRPKNIAVFIQMTTTKAKKPKDTKSLS